MKKDFLKKFKIKLIFNYFNKRYLKNLIFKINEPKI